jgi:hypothetical protein
MNQLNDKKLNGSESVNSAGSAAGQLNRAGTGGASTAQAHVLKQHTDGDKPNGKAGNVVVANTKLNKRVVAECQQCGRPYYTERPTVSKYCGPACRRAAWLAAHPDKATAIAQSDRARLRAHFMARGLNWEERGASRAGVAFWLAVLVAILAVGWYYGPTVQASRAAMAERAYTVTVSDPQRPAAAMPTPIVPAAQPQPTLPQNAPTIAPERPAAAMPTPQPQPAQPTPQPQISAAALARLDAQIAQAGRVVVECKAVQMADPFTNYHCERPARALATLQAQRAQVAP